MVIDCSETVNFLQELGRMCKNCDYDCSECTLSANCNGTGDYCMDYVKNNPDRAVEVVQKWSDEHPVRTRLDDLKEKHPNVPLDGNGLPNYSPSMLGYCWDCLKCRCWDKPGTGTCWHEPVDGGATGKAVE